MATKKKTIVVEPEIVEVEVVEAEVVEKPTNTGLVEFDPDTIRSMLKTNVDKYYEPAFVDIIANKTGTFTAPGLPLANDEEVEGIILSAEPTRALWGIGTKADLKIIGNWKGKIPLCSAIGRDCDIGKGTMNKPLDDSAPDMVKMFLEPIIACGYKCMAGSDKGCPWSAFGSHGKGMACKENRRFLIFHPLEKTYAALKATATSLNVWRKYQGGLPNRNYSSVVTRFTIEVQNDGGSNTWAGLRFRNIGDVTNDMLQPLSKMVLYKGRSMPEFQAVGAVFQGVVETLEDEDEFRGEVDKDAPQADDF